MGISLTAITKALLLACLVAAFPAKAGFKAVAQETQPSLVWSDPARGPFKGLMWVLKDNGKDISVKDAKRYCQDLRLAGYSDWRLANPWELNAIYDKTVHSPGMGAKGPRTYHVRGNIFVTGFEWAGDENQHSAGYHPYYDFLQGTVGSEESGFLHSNFFMRALCVRGDQKLE